MAEKELVKQLSIKQPDSDTYITRDIGVDYQNVVGLDTDAEAAKAKKATGDKNGKDITSYVSSVTLGNDDALNIKDGTPNAEGTTYQLAMQGATGMENGRRGFVPRPKAGDQGKVLKGDGTWSYSPANDNIAKKEVTPATAEHKTGDRIIFQGILYKVIDDIEIGDALVVNSNIELSAPIADCMSEAANSIANLAPAYDPTLTYNVGDLVTYIDEQNSGKLYKCIIAVTSPMEFNINYWDDVTTSEVYRIKETVLATFTGDGTKTFLDMINAFMPVILEHYTDIAYCHDLFVRFDDNGQELKFDRCNFTRGYEGVSFSSVTGGYPTTYLALLSCLGINDDTHKQYASTRIESSGNTMLDNTNIAVPSGRVAKLIRKVQ